MSKTSKVETDKTANGLFISMGLDMSWRLTLSVLVPIIGGVELDNALSTSPLFLFIGFALAIVGASFIIRRAVRVANDHPVLNPPKADLK